MRKKPYSKIVVGCDNGSTGTVCAFGDGKLLDFIEQFSYKWRKPQVKSRDSYMSRIDFKKFLEWLISVKSNGAETVAVVERPMTDQTRLHQTLSSHHAQEALMIALDQAGIEFMTVDSSEWQKIYLPGVSGSKILKLKSKERASFEFPEFLGMYKKHGDADAIYIAKLVVDGNVTFIPDYERRAPKGRTIKKKVFATNFKEETPSHEPQFNRLF